MTPLQRAGGLTFICMDAIKEKAPATKDTGHYKEPMKNIHHRLEIVNNPTKKQIAEATEQAIYNKSTLDKEPTHILVLADGNKLFYNPDLSYKAKHCSLSVPSLQAGLVPEKKKKERKSRDEIFPMKAKIRNLEYIPDHFLEAMKECQSSRGSYLYLESYDGTKRVFKGMTKGSASYNYKLQQKAIKDAEVLSQEHEFLYFLTLTYSPNDFGHDRDVAFLLFSESLRGYLKEVKRKFGVEWQLVVEVTNKGYPHAHVILYSNKALVPDAIKHMGKKGIITGDFYRFLNEKWQLGFINLQKGYNSKVSHYLAKYMGKSNFDSDPAKDRKTAKLTKANRKALMTTYLPCVYGYRAYRTSWKKGADGKKQVSQVLTQEEGFEEFSEPNEKPLIKQQYDVVAKAVRRTANLIYFSIKENKRCSGMVQIARKTGLKPLKKGYCCAIKGKVHPAIRDEVLQIIPKGCSGCKFLEFIQDNYAKIMEDPVNFFSDVFISDEELLEIRHKETRNELNKMLLEEIRENRRAYGAITDFQKDMLKRKLEFIEELEGKEFRRQRAFMIYEYEMENRKRFGDVIKITKKDAWKISK